MEGREHYCFSMFVCVSVGERFFLGFDFVCCLLFLYLSLSICISTVRVILSSSSLSSQESAEDEAAVNFVLAENPEIVQDDVLKLAFALSPPPLQPPTPPASEPDLPPTSGDEKFRTETSVNSGDKTSIVGQSNSKNVSKTTTYGKRIEPAKTGSSGKKKKKGKKSKKKKKGENQKRQKFRKNKRLETASRSL